MKRIEVYDAEDQLVAAFAFGAEPLYFGASGATVKALVSRDYGSFDPWRTQQYGGLATHEWTALISTVCQALVGSGFRTVVHGMPPLQSEEGTVY